MAGKKDTGSNGRGPDIIHFIRSMQRIDGNRDCFGKAKGQCDLTECPWYRYCSKVSGFQIEKSRKIDKIETNKEE